MAVSKPRNIAEDLADQRFLLKTPRGQWLPASNPNVYGPGGRPARGVARLSERTAVRADFPPPKTRRPDKIHVPAEPAPKKIPKVSPPPGCEYPPAPPPPARGYEDIFLGNSLGTSYAVIEAGRLPPRIPPPPPPPRKIKVLKPGACAPNPDVLEVRIPTRPELDLRVGVLPKTRPEGERPVFTCPDCDRSVGAWATSYDGDLLVCDACWLGRRRGDEAVLQR